MEWRLR